MNKYQKYIYSEFPESIFVTHKATRCEYLHRMELGLERIQNSTITIVGLCRDCEKILPYTIARLERLGRLFKKSHVFVYENDSKDRTKEILSGWAKNNQNVSVSLNELNKPIHQSVQTLERTVDMAFYRNQYMEYLQNRPCTDFIAVYDFDLAGGFSYHGVYNSFGYDCWDGVGSNSFGLDSEDNLCYYDNWAFREYGDEKWKNQHQLKYRRGDQPVEVNSCFGGLAFYKYEHLVNYKYLSGDCDHPTIHKQMRRNGSHIYMNPSQITLYNKHIYM